MRSLESRANDEFLFVSNHVTLSAINEVETQISSFGITKKVANLGSIPINLPPSQKQLRSIPSSAFPSRALSPPLPPELVDLLPKALRDNSTGEDMEELDDLHILSTEFVDNSAFRTSTGSSNYDYINDMVTDNVEVPSVLRAGNDSSFLAPLVCLDDAINVIKSDTVKSDSSFSTTTSTMSSSSSLFNGSDNGMETNLKNAVLTTPSVSNISIQEKTTCKLENNSTISNVAFCKKLRTVANADTNYCSSWKESQVRDISCSNFLYPREDVDNYQQRRNQCYDPLMKAYPSVITTQQHNRYHVSTNYRENAGREKYISQNRHRPIGLMGKKKDGKKPENFKFSADDHGIHEGSHYSTALLTRKGPTSASPKKPSEQESDGIYDNFLVVRNDEKAKESYAIKSQSPSPLPYRRKMYSPPFIAQSSHCIVEIGETEPHFSIPCETCSHATTNSERSRSCERSRFSPPGFPLFGRRYASPWKNRSGNLPLLRIPEGTFERKSEPYRTSVEGHHNIFCNQRAIQHHLIYENQEYRDKSIDPILNDRDQMHSFESSLLYLKENKIYGSVQNDKGNANLKKSYTFYEYMKNWLRKPQ